MINKIKGIIINFLFVIKICSRKPRLFIRILAGYFKAVFLKQINLRFMDISLTYECNFKCTHCSALGLKRNDSLLTVDEYRKLASDAMLLGVVNFHFTGGEPLLKKDLFDIIRCFDPSKNIISIATNAWYVNNKFLEDFRMAGGDIVCISIDSVKPQDHDRFRKKDGSWKRAIDGLKSAKKLGLRVLMATTITHSNLRSQDFNELINFSKSLGVVLSLNLAVPSGRWKGEQSLLLDGKDRKYLNSLLSHYKHLRTDFESNWHIRGCPAFKEKLYLTPYGDVMPCPFIPISFGNTKNISLSEIRKKALSYKLFRTYHPICLAAEDKNFIKNAGCYEIDSEELPLAYKKSRLFQR